MIPFHVQSQCDNRGNMWKFNPLSLTVLALALIPSLPVTSASPLYTRSPYVVKDNHPLPGGWEIIARAPSQDNVRLQIGLKYGRFDELERHLYEGIIAFLPPTSRTVIVAD